jgi:hypothetical protein
MELFKQYSLKYPSGIVFAGAYVEISLFLIGTKN